MSDPLPAPKTIQDPEDEAPPAAGDRDSALLALLCAILALAALAVYKLADVIGSACWACG